jgi:hypothetical protein
MCAMLLRTLDAGLGLSGPAWPCFCAGNGDAVVARVQAEFWQRISSVSAAAATTMPANQRG